MAWNEAVITNEGLKLLSECVTEGNIIITRAVSGEGYAAPISLMAQKEVLPNLHPLNIAYIHIDEGVITVNVRIRNNGVDTPYTIRQIGLYAKKDASDNEILFALVQDSNGEVIPSSKENPEYLSEFDFVIPISNSENIDVNVTPNTFATIEDISEVKNVIDGHISDNIRHIPLGGSSGQILRWSADGTAVKTFTANASADVTA
ncbi:MAG: hypothetical protein NC320_12790, partial [Clostridium sp.]|nr:hypothetical protein [Clostridium sp.]